MPDGPPPSVALLLHGRIGVWSIKPSLVPPRDQNLLATKDLRKLADAVSRPPLDSFARESNTSLWDLERRPHGMMLGYARFASTSILQRVVEPNRRAGLQLDIFLHSWHPEIGKELDLLYRPVASRHDAPLRVHKVESHHLSMKRGLELVTAPRSQPYEMVMVARFDLLFFSDLLFQPLLQQGAPLWLPTWCMRYQVNGPQFHRLNTACGGRGQGTAYVLTPPRVSVMHARLRSTIDPADDVDMAMLDWWFIAPPAIATSFGSIADYFGHYTRGLNRRYPVLPKESHYYWAYHVHHVLRLGGALRYLPDQLEGRDFRLARQWMYGTHCSYSLARAFPKRAPADQIRELALDLSQWDRRASRWNGLERVHRNASPTRARQCPFDPDVKTFCPWVSPVCSDALKQDTLDVEAAAKRVFAETTRIRPLPKIWLATELRQKFRVKGLTVGARRNFTKRARAAATRRGS